MRVARRAGYVYSPRACRFPMISARAVIRPILNTLTAASSRSFWWRQRDTDFAMPRMQSRPAGGFVAKRQYRLHFASACRKSRPMRCFILIALYRRRDWLKCPRHIVILNIFARRRRFGGDDISDDECAKRALIRSYLLHLNTTNAR